MCLIIGKQKGVSLTERFFTILEAGWEVNHGSTYGGGFAYRSEGKVMYDRGFFYLTNIEKAIRELRVSEEDELVVHIRLGTSGSIKNNSHPFVIPDICGIQGNDYNKAIELYKNAAKVLRNEQTLENGEALLFHNGVMSQFAIASSQYCDTAIFAASILAPVPLEHRAAILEHFSNSNRFVYMDKDSTSLFGSWSKDGEFLVSNNAYLWARSSGGSKFLHDPQYNDYGD